MEKNKEKFSIYKSFVHDLYKTGNVLNNRALPRCFWTKYKEYVIYGNSCRFPLHTKAQILFSLEKLLSHIRLNRIVRLLRFSRARASITQHRLARQKTCFSRKYRLLFAIYISSLKFGRTLRFLSTKQLILRSYVEKCVLHPFFSNRGKTWKTSEFPYPV